MAKRTKVQVQVQVYVHPAKCYGFDFYGQAQGTPFANLGGAEETRKREGITVIFAPTTDLCSLTTAAPKKFPHKGHLASSPAETKR